MRVDFNVHGVDCVFQSWGSNKFVADGDEWKFGSEASNWARQGRVSLIEHEERFSNFRFGGSFQPTVADGDSGAPLLCSLANQDALHEGVVFALVTKSFVYRMYKELREVVKKCYDCDYDFADGIDVRIFYGWIKKNVPRKSGIMFLGLFLTGIKLVSVTIVNFLS